MRQMQCNKCILTNKCYKCNNQNVRNAIWPMQSDKCKYTNIMWKKQHVKCNVPNVMWQMQFDKFNMTNVM